LQKMWVRFGGVVLVILVLLQYNEKSVFVY
jgi:hypothetical protein